MDKKLIDGKIRKIESKSDSRIFFDFEFWGESDEDTYGLLCFIQISNPKNLFIVEMNSNELAHSSNHRGVEALKERVSTKTGVSDLVIPKVIRFDEQKNDTTAGFQAFLKAYKKPLAVYESIFDQAEAVQVEKLSIEEFKGLGGSIILLGDILLCSPNVQSNPGSD